ncbi:MAG: WYL domain-containing protein [Deltaproteobacteria bacterium]|nr:WYL domain-containing protein [Deltaproteobacteria bacterium]
MKSQDKRLRRALYLVPYITKLGDKGILLSELAAMVGVTASALKKELLALFEVAVPDGTDSLNIFIDPVGDDARVWMLPCRLLRRPPRLTTQEALALLIGAEAVKSTGFRPYDAAIERAAAKIRDVFRRQSDNDASGVSPSQGKIDPAFVVLAAPGTENRATMATLSRACREHRTVELDYASLSSQKRKQIRVEPYGLLNHTGCWYVLGKSLTHEENRIFVFKVERILGVKALDTTFAPPADFDIRKYQGESMFITDWKPVRVTLRLTKASAERLRGRIPEGKRERGGARLVTFKDHITGWLAAWVLRQGDGVSVVEPVELRQWVAKLAARVVEAHG